MILSILLLALAGTTPAILARLDADDFLERERACGELRPANLLAIALARPALSAEQSNRLRAAWQRMQYDALDLIPRETRERWHREAHGEEDRDPKKPFWAMPNP